MSFADDFPVISIQNNEYRYVKFKTSDKIPIWVKFKIADVNLPML